VNHEKAILQQRKRRQFRVRKRMHGNAARPRLTVFRSHKHLYAQLIDDTAGRTLCAASTVDKDLRGALKYGGNKTAAVAIGKAIAGGTRGGLIVSTALGFVGALFGPWLARSMGLPEPFMVTIGGQPFPVLWSIIGACLFVAIIHLISILS